MLKELVFNTEVKHQYIKEKETRTNKTKIHNTSEDLEKCHVENTTNKLKGVCKYDVKNYTDL